MRLTRGLAFLLVLLCAATAVVRGDGASLVGFWALNEAPGSTVAADSSGNGYNSTCNVGVYIGTGRGGFAGCPAFGVQGVPGFGGSAASFTGTPDAPQFLAVPNVIPDSFTVALWIKTTDSGPSWTSPGDPAYWGNGIVWSDIGGDANDMIPMSVVGGRLSFGTESCGYDTLTSTVPINTGQWIHLAVTRDTATGAKKIYINGVLDNSSFTCGGSLNANGMIAIGANPLDSRYFNGTIQNVFFFNRALSASEVQSLTSPPTPTLLPVANAGGPYFTSPGQATVLDASHSFDPNIPPTSLTYSWSPTSVPAGSNGGTLTNAQSAQAIFTPDVEGIYRFSLTVTNSVGQSTALASVGAGIPPLANAGGPYSAVTGQGVTLDGSQSADPNVPPAPLAFAWSVTNGPGASTLVNDTTATPTFTPDFPGTYTITLTTTNSVGETATAAAIVNVTAAAVASNGGTCTVYCQVPPSSSVSGNVTVAPGAFLEVDGTIGGNVNLSSGGTLVLAGGTLGGNVQVAADGTLVVNGGTIGGNTSVNSGATLQAFGAQFSHNLQVNGAGIVTIQGGSVRGNLGFSGAQGIYIGGVSVSGNLTISGTTGSYFGYNYVFGMNVKGDLTIQNNSSSSPFNLGVTCGGGNNTIGHNATIQNNLAPISFDNNSVGANLSCTGNAPGFGAAGDRVSGKATAQCTNATQPIDFNQCF